MAGFEVALTGRFWVAPDIDKPDYNFLSIIHNWAFADSNSNHLAIGVLASHGYLPRIISLNFDTLIEDNIGCEHLVLTPDDESWEDSAAVTVFKPHGTLARRDDGGVDDSTIRFTLQALSRNADALKDQMQSIVHGRQLVVLGYSDDDLDVTPSVISAGATALHWLVYKKDGEETISEDFKAPRRIGPRDCTTVYLGSSEDFTASLLRLLIPSTKQKAPRSQALGDRQELDLGALTMSPHLSAISVADLLEKSSEWDLAIRFFQFLLKNQKVAFSPTLTDFIHLRIAQAFRAQGAVDQSLKAFSKASRSGGIEETQRLISLEALVELAHGYWQQWKRRGSLLGLLRGVGKVLEVSWHSTRLLRSASGSMRRESRVLLLTALFYTGDLFHFHAHAALLLGFRWLRPFILRLTLLFYHRAVHQLHKVENHYWLHRLHEVEAELGIGQLGLHRDFFRWELRRYIGLQDRLGRGNALAALGLVASLDREPVKADIYLRTAARQYFPPVGPTHPSGALVIGVYRCLARLSSRQEALALVKGHWSNRQRCTSPGGTTY